MKLPLSLNLSIFYRLFLPGALLTIFLLPLIISFQKMSGIDFSIEYAVTLMIVFLGWLIVVCDMQIYMLYEGRRYWPAYLRRFFVGWEKRRLRRLVEREGAAWKAKQLQKYREFGVEIRRFPVDENDKPIAEWPTRLGNLICSYEDYPEQIYGLSAVFFWDHMFFLLDKDLRGQLDGSQAQADSTIYASFSFLIGFVIFLIYAITDLAGLPYFAMFPGPGLMIFVSLFCLGASYAIYRLSLHTHARFGQMFKAAFDQYAEKIDFGQVVDDIVALTGDSSLKTASRQEKYKAVWRYLHNYRVLDPKDGSIVPIAQLRALQRVSGSTASGNAAGNPESGLTGVRRALTLVLLFLLLGLGRRTIHQPRSPDNKKAANEK